VLPAAAQAQYPYDWHGATPPSWFAESIDSSCQTRESYSETVSGDSRWWSILWARNPEGNSCFKPVPFSPELGEGAGYFCNGAVSYSQTDGSPDNYQAVWDCSLGDSSYACKRNSHYEESPLGDPNESYNYDSGGWHEFDPVTGGAKDCVPKESTDDVEPVDNSACDRAKQKVKKAKKKVRKADTPFEKTKAKNKLKKAKQKKKEACA
jgi:hypothetical protein